MKYLCGCEDDRRAVNNQGGAVADDYVDYICYQCKSRKGPHYLDKYEVVPGQFRAFDRYADGRLK